MLVGSSTGRQGRVAALPAEANEFIGRAAELRRVAELLRANRLVTLVGPGGVGKTRIAIRAAERAAPGYPDGATFVQLSALRDPELLPHTVASRLGLPEQSPGTQLDAVLAHLRDRRLLLILDTCEHIIDAAALFAETVITETPNITILATTREPLNITAENCYAVPTLTLPNDDALPGDGDGENGDDGDASADAGPGSADAVELFALRAAAVAPGFTVTDANRAVIIDVCRRLDGLPLAIELAAARLKALPLAELAGRLEHRLPLLTGGRDGQDARHRTLRDAIGWSHDLCTQAEQTLWARLSVFAGSFGIDAAEDVCASSELPRGEIFETIIRLVDKSVLRKEEPSAEESGGGHPTRYRMLDTIREFGAEQLADSGAETGIRDRFIARYLAKARYFGEHPVDDDQLDKFRELRLEHFNVLAALEYTLGADGRERDREGAELATSLYSYWHMSGLLRQGRYWLAKVLDRFPEPSSPERGSALIARGYLGAMQGEAAEAVADATAGIQIGLARGDDRLVGRGYVYLTLALTIADRYEEARAAGAEAQRLCEAVDDRAGLAIHIVHLAHLAHLSGDMDGALRYVEQGLRRYGDTDEIKERWAQGWLYAIAAMALFWSPSNDAETARTTSKALLAKHQLGDAVGMAYCLEIGGWLAGRAGRHVRAAWLLGAADPLWDRAGGRLGGTAALLQVHAQTSAAAREALGGKRFDALFAEAGRHPIDQVVAFAVGDGEQPAAHGAKWRLPDQLTDREAEIADLAARGMSSRQIAEHLFISRRTVDAHLEHIYGKLGISSRVELLNAIRLYNLGLA